jgi:hypothetical protein
VTGDGTPERPFELPVTCDGSGPALAVWFPPNGPQPVLHASRGGARPLAPGRSRLPTDALVAGLEAEAVVAPEIADLIWNRDLAAGLDGSIGRWSGGDGRIVPPLNPPTGVDVVTLEDLAVGSSPTRSTSRNSSTTNRP